MKYDFYYCKTCGAFYYDPFFMESNCECAKCAEKKRASKNADTIRDYEAMRGEEE